MNDGHAAPIRVLVLDDEPSIRILCRVVLELEGCDVVEAATVAGARQALADASVDVLVVDLNLRGERTVELIAECRSGDTWIPVILVTGSAGLGDEDAPEADAVFGKPFDMDELVAAVRRLAAAARDARNARPDPGA